FHITPPVTATKPSGVSSDPPGHDEHPVAGCFRFFSSRRALSGSVQPLSPRSSERFRWGGNSFANAASGLRRILLQCTSPLLAHSPVAPGTRSPCLPHHQRPLNRPYGRPSTGGGGP